MSPRAQLVISNIIINSDRKKNVKYRTEPNSVIDGRSPISNTGSQARLLCSRQAGSQAGSMAASIDSRGIDRLRRLYSAASIAATELPPPPAATVSNGNSGGAE